MQIPTFLRGTARAWMAFSHLLGRIMSRIILTVFWLLCIGLYAVLWKFARLFTRSPVIGSMWKDATPQTAASMRYQF